MNVEVTSDLGFLSFSLSLYLLPSLSSYLNDHLTYIQKLLRIHVHVNSTWGIPLPLLLDDIHNGFFSPLPDP